MQNLVLFDDARQITLLPLTYTRPVSELRVGILTIREKWEKWLGVKVSWLTRDYLRNKYPLAAQSDNLYVNSGILPDEKLIEALSNLKPGESYTAGNTIIAARTETFEEVISGKTSHKNYNSSYTDIQYPYHIFSHNANEIRRDYKLLTHNRQSAGLNGSNQILNENQLFVEEGAEANFAKINASTGPVYIGKNAQIMEGSLIRGPFAMHEGAMLKLGAKIYGATTIGPYSKIGGEVKNVVVQGYSNKAHEGFLGDAAIGEWCNLGADTNNSNLKNNYTEVKLWDYATERFRKTGLTFCGLVMGDHSKCGINTMFNTGTVVGVSANIFGSGFPRNFIPSFSWGGAHGFTNFKLSKAMEVAAVVMERKSLKLGEEDRAILHHVHDISAKYRK